MNHNKYNLKVGERVIADEKYRGGYEVTIEEFTPNQLFALVKDDEGNKWQIMTNRLTKLENGRI